MISGVGVVQRKAAAERHFLCEKNFKNATLSILDAGSILKSNLRQQHSIQSNRSILSEKYIQCGTKVWNLLNISIMATYAKFDMVILGNSHLLF